MAGQATAPGRERDENPAHHRGCAPGTIDPRRPDARDASNMHRIPPQPSRPGACRGRAREAGRRLSLQRHLVKDESILVTAGRLRLSLEDDDGTVQGRYNIRALPTAVLIDRQGRIRRVHQGMADESELSEQIEGLL